MYGAVQSARVAVAALALLFLAAGCGRQSQTTMNRCYAGVSLAEAISAVGVPPHEEAWGVSAAESSSRNRLFENIEEATLRLESPRFTRDLCSELAEQLGRECVVASARFGSDFCTFTTEPWSRPSTAGLYSQGATEGRISLFAERLPDGRTTFLLAGTEWAAN